MTTYALLVLLLVTIECSSAKKLPPFLTLCHRTDPKLNQCIKNAVEQIRPHLLDGIPELFLPSMNPLHLPRAGLETGGNFKADFENIRLFHVNEFTVDHLEVNLDTLHIELGLTFPRIRTISQYHVDGRLLILQLHGEGPADGNFTDVRANAVLQAQLKPKNGKDYISVVDAKLDLRLGTPVFNFENIFRKNDELNERTNRIINDNVVDILDELRPIIDKTVIEFCLGIINPLFNRFSFDELFPK